MNSNDRSILSKNKLQEIVAQIDPRYALEPEVEEILLDIADEFIESVTNFGCTLAKHRGSDILEVKDLQLHLEKNWNIRVPGFTDQTSIKPVRKSQPIDIHTSRIKLVKKSLQQMNAKKV